MTRNLFKTVIVLIPFCFFLSKSVPVNAQDAVNHTQSNLFSTAQVTIDQSDWTFDKETQKADVNLTITNHASLDIKSVTISLTAQDKNGIMLQSEAQTLKQDRSDSIISAKEKKVILFKNAYSNPAVYNISIKKITIEYQNGSLEVLE